MRASHLGELATQLHSSTWSPGAGADAVLRTRLLALSGRDWLRFDEAARRQGHRVTPDAGLPAWRARLAGSTDVLAAGTASLHPDGHVRQLGVEVLAQAGDVLAAAFLAARATDWVHEVRDLAARALAARVSRAELRLSVPVLLACVTRQRSDVATQLLRQVAATGDSILALTSHPDRSTALWALGACRDRGMLPEHRLLAVALHARDQIAATWCARELAAIVDGPADDVARRLLAAPRALAKAAALQGFPDRLLPEPTMRRLCLDQSPKVLSLARWRFTQLGGDAVALYDEALRSAAGATRLAAALSALSESPEHRPFDLAAVAVHLTHQSPTVRRAAVIAVGTRAGHSDVARLLVPCLHDGSAKVVAAVLRQLKAKEVAVSEQQIPAAGSADPRQSRRTILRLRQRRGGWHRVEANLLALASGDEELASAGRTDLLVWIRDQAASTWQGPSPEQAARLQNLLTDADLTLAEKRQIAFHAGLPGR